MHYQLIKKQDNLKKLPTLVFLHGFLGCHRDWLPVITKLTIPNPCLLIDLPGHSQSKSIMPITFSILSYKIAQILKKEKITQIILIGYSLGGRVALHFSHNYPDYIQKLILISSHLGLDSISEKIKRLHHDTCIAQKMLTIPWLQFIKQWYDTPLFETFKKSIYYTKTITKRHQQNPNLMAKALIQLSLAHQPNYTTLCQQYPFPIHYLCGQNDHKFYKLGQNYSRFLNVHVIPNTDHALHITDSESLSLFLDQILLPF
tara:strand:- start:273 stop:1049 length:777 start_codon:yes stop_codon:yes gene_type:complete